MASLTQSDVLGHPEYQRLYKYRLIIKGDIPGVDIGPGGKHLDFRCLGFTAPEKTHTPIQGRIKGMPFQTQGFPEFNQSIPMQFVEGEDALVISAINAWSNEIYDSATGKMKPKQDYLREAVLQALKIDDTPASSWTLLACSPQVVTGGSFAGETNDVWRVDFTLNYLTFDYNKGGEPNDR